MDRNGREASAPRDFFRLLRFGGRQQPRNNKQKAQNHHREHPPEKKGRMGAREIDAVFQFFEFAEGGDLLICFEQMFPNNGQIVAWESGLGIAKIKVNRGCSVRFKSQAAD